MRAKSKRREKKKQDDDLVDVSLKTHIGAVYRIQFPANVTTNKFIPTLLSKLGYPNSASDGHNVIYKLEIVYDGGSYRLSDKDCPGELVRKFKNAHLVLLPELTAG